jgi:hypothetical protein
LGVVGIGLRLWAHLPVLGFSKAEFISIVGLCAVHDVQRRLSGAYCRPDISAPFLKPSIAVHEHAGTADIWVLRRPVDSSPAVNVLAREGDDAVVAPALNVPGGERALVGLAHDLALLTDPCGRSCRWASVSDATMGSWAH